MYYKLLRQPAKDNAVRGKLYWTSHYINKRTGELVERLHYICDTLENADKLIPALIYRVQVTQSPRFKRLLPILCQVPGRTGIRFHRGSLPEHSRGCILVTDRDLCNQLTNTLLQEQQHNEPTYIEIYEQPANLQNH